MKQQLVLILLLQTLFFHVYAQKNVCKNIYVWNFTNQDGKQDNLTKTLTDEFENALTGDSGCVVVDRRDFSASFEQNKNESAILSLNDIGETRKSQLSTIKAQIVVFGKIEYNELNDLYVLKVKFQNIETSQLLRSSSINISRTDTRKIEVVQNKIYCFVNSLIKGKDCPETFDKSANSNLSENGQAIPESNIQSSKVSGSDYATIIIFSINKITSIGTFSKYTLYGNNDEEITRIGNGTYFEYHTKEGIIMLKAGCKKCDPLEMPVEKGKTYYLKCETPPGGFVGRKSKYDIRFVERDEAIPVISKQNK